MVHSVVSGTRQNEAFKSGVGYLVGGGGGAVTMEKRYNST